LIKAAVKRTASEWAHYKDERHPSPRGADHALAVKKENSGQSILIPVNPHLSDIRL
jgi:hypothetical protein